MIHAHGITFAYNGIPVLEDVNLDLAQGEILCLFGPNGCGKTTLLDIILGHLKSAGGSITIGGRDQREYSHMDLAKKIAYVPQVHERTFPHRVIDIVVMGRTPHLPGFSSPGKEDYAIAEEALALAGIPHLKKRIYTKLSGGETQLVILARALAQKAPVILMDEPASHLDFRHELALLETVAGLVGDKKISVIMSTHSPNHAFHFENRGIPVRVAVMYNREIAASGSPEEVLSEEMMMRIFSMDAKVFSHKHRNAGKIRYMVPLGISRQGDEQ